MNNIHTSTSIAPSLNLTLSPKTWAAGLLAWVIAKDQAYKQRCHFRELSDEALKDVGLTR